MSCYDCTVSERFRRAAAAGQGLPAIEPGMPLPAGTGMTRREFVSRSAGLALAVYGGSSALSTLALDDGIAAAAANAPANQKVLVSIFLNGGIDALNVLFPAGDPLYYSLRPNLAIAQTAGRPFPEDERLRWHPSADSLATLHAEGKVSVLQAVGYDNSDKSHFTARHYYEVGQTDVHLRTGWLGRFLDRVGVEDNPVQGLTLDAVLHPALATAKVPVATLQGADQYQFAPPGIAAHPLEASMLQMAANIGAAHKKSTDAGLKQAGSISYDAHHLYYQLGNFKYGFASPVAYPSSADPFPRRMAGLAAMIASGMPVRVVGLTMGRFDTHAGQAGAFNRDLGLASASLYAFQRDLEARGVADRVLVHVWSEFGRRGAQNASNGTDHGSAGIGFLIGTKVKGQQVGSFPGVTGGLDGQGNLRPSADFRAVYSAILEQWLDIDANEVIPGVQPFKRPAILK
jgi:uncharacterized protein (DUF1501 family)